MKLLWDRAGLLLIAAVTLLLDQVTKALVVRFLSPAETWNFSPFLARFVNVTYVTNTGAAFGLFPNQGFLFIIIAVVVAAVILVYYRRLPAGQALIRLALGLQLTSLTSTSGRCRTSRCGTSPTPALSRVSSSWR
jgi:lipoprotein signal peptidase